MARAKKNPRRGKPPAYQWYPGDALADEEVSTMTLEEEGAYRRLLDHHWREGSIPADQEKLRRLCKWVGKRKFASIWNTIGARFSPSSIDGRLENSRIAAQRQTLEVYSDTQAENGRKGANELHAKRVSPTTSPDDRHDEALADGVANPGSAYCDLRTAIYTSPTGEVVPAPAGAEAVPVQPLALVASEPTVPKVAAKRRQKPPADPSAPPPPVKEPPPFSVDRAVDLVAAAAPKRFARPAEIPRESRINIAQRVRAHPTEDQWTWLGAYLEAGGHAWLKSPGIGWMASNGVVDALAAAAKWHAAGRPDPNAQAARPSARPSGEITPGRDWGGV